MGHDADDSRDAASYREFEERIKSSFAARVRALREGMAIGVRTLGSRVGISGSMVSNYETAKGLPSINTFLRLAWELGVSPDSLLTPHSLPAVHGAAPTRSECLQLISDRLTDSQIRFLAELSAAQLRTVVDALRGVAGGAAPGGASLIHDSDDPPPRRTRRRH